MSQTSPSRPRGRRPILIGSLAALVAAASAAVLLVAREPNGPAPSGFVDAHVHPVRAGRETPLALDLPKAIETMDAFRVPHAILLPPPFPIVDGLSYGREQLGAAARAHPERFAFIAGGESLNPMLQATPADAVSAEALEAFKREAEAIADAGAVGFGELALEHFSNGKPRHPYESARPDHPLMLALADIAAQRGLAIDVHMEMLAQDRDFPEHRKRGGPFAEHLKENVSRLERLLEHNPKARIVWSHAGWDLTEERTPAAMSELLSRHDNLFMSIKLDDIGPLNDWPLAEDGTHLRPHWLALLEAFPDRFVVGSDQFFDGGRARIGFARKFFDALPPKLARKIGVENVRRIYRVPGSWN